MILISIVAPSASMMLGLYPLSLKRAPIACSKDGNSIIAAVFEMPASKIAVVAQNLLVYGWRLKMRRDPPKQAGKLPKRQVWRHPAQRLPSNS